VNSACGRYSCNTTTTTTTCIAADENQAKSQQLTFSSLECVLRFRKSRHGCSEGSAVAIYSCTTPTNQTAKKKKVRSGIQEISNVKSIEQRLPLQQIDSNWWQAQVLEVGYSKYKGS
jgi:hypothetical protein